MRGLGLYKWQKKITKAIDQRMTDLKTIHYHDSISDLASVMEEVGTRRFLSDFRHNYPKHFDEVVVQIARLDQRKVPALLKKPEGSQ